MEAIVTIISTVGFPIAACLLLGWFIWHIYKRSEAREMELRQEIKENQAVNKEAIQTLAQYAERLNVIQTDIEVIKEDIIIISDKISQ